MAQDPTGAIEGAITDTTGTAIPRAPVTTLNLDTGLTKDTEASSDGFYRVLLLPVGRYRITVTAPQFATLTREPIAVNVAQVARVNLQVGLSSLPNRFSSPGRRPARRSPQHALGRVVSGRELVDLPLNGRNFTQLGLLQTGVAPLTLARA